MNEPLLENLRRRYPPLSPLGRAPPSTRLDKATTYTRLDPQAKPFTTQLWDSVDPNTFFTPRAVDGYVLECREHAGRVEQQRAVVLMRAEAQGIAQEGVQDGTLTEVHGAGADAAEAMLVSAAAMAAEASAAAMAAEASAASPSSSSSGAAATLDDAAAAAPRRRRRRPWVVSLSHFVPRQDLLPEKRMLLHGFLHKVSGSCFLERQLRQLLPDVHVFGHTHLNVDATVDGVRYVQWPLGTPREQRGQTRVSSFGLLNLYDGSDGGEAPQHWTHWSHHYELYERDLSKTAFPPYILKFRGLMSGGGGLSATPKAKPELPKEPPKSFGSGLVDLLGGKLSWGQEGRLQEGKS